MDDQFELMLSRRTALSADQIDDSDWSDVRRRAGNRPPLRSRRAAVLVATLVLGAVFAAPGWGIGSQLDDLFSGQSATPDVQQAVHQSDVGAPPGMAPGIEADQTHKLISIQLADGRQETLWVAPSRSGALCEYLQRGEKALPGAGCGPAVVPSGMIYWGLEGHGEFDSTVVIDGRVPDGVASLELQYADGTTASLPLTDGFFLYEIPASHFAQGHRPSLLIAKNGNGDEVARASLDQGSNTIIYPDSNPSSGG